jgi:hypothetical protein
MTTYPKALRTIIPHLTLIMPTERNPSGHKSTGTKLATKSLSIRIPENLKQQIDEEAERRGQGWNATQITEQALRWYFELINEYRKIGG